MKINLVKWTNILERVQQNTEMAKAFYKFYAKLKEVDWQTPNDVLGTFNSADIIKCDSGSRIVFNVGGNKYRLICGYFFGKTYTQLFVKFVGTHQEYNSIDVCKVNMFKK